jgi:DNA-binding MarR family transcriptional regulator
LLYVDESELFVVIQPHVLDISTTLLEMYEKFSPALEDTLFYRLDKTIKSYRQFAQQKIKEAGLNVTVDQWLVLKTLYDHSGLNQKDLAKRVFKDHGSITRMLELLIHKELVRREVHASDRRYNKLYLSPNGLDTCKQLFSVVADYRSIALEGINLDDQALLRDLLKRITENCR